jgi:hypothetical protein
MAEKKTISYSEKNKQRIEQMLERDAGATRAVVANTIETKKLASKLQIVDIIFNNARQQIGYRVQMNDFMKLFDKFQEADKAIDDMIEQATALKIYIPRNPKGSTFKENKEKIEKLLEAKKSAADIAKELSIEESKITAWIGLIEKEKAPATAASAKTEAKKAS